MTPSVILVYSLRQYVLRITYYPDRESEVPGIMRQIAAHKGGSQVGAVIGNRNWLHYMTPQQMLAQLLGHKPKNDRCKQMRGLKQIGTIHADPTIDFDHHGMGIRLVPE